MSFDEVQEDYSLARDLAKNSRHPRSFRWQRKGNVLLQKKLADQLVVSKTIYDPANTLSNRAKKRLQKEESLSDFQPDVQYSLNKHQRWKRLSIPTLLENSGHSNHEILVVNRVITPRRLTAIENLDVSEVHAKENGTIRTISTKGKGHKYSHFQAALRERREVDKDEVEPARILINVVEPHPVTRILAGKAQRRNKKGSLTTKSRHLNYSSEVSQTSCSEDEDEDPFDSGEQTKARRSSFTLGDFLWECSASTSCSRERSRKSSSWSFVEEKPVCLPESDQPKPADLVDISAITNVKSVFEVIDLKAHRLQKFNFPNTLLRLEQERYAVRWIDPYRAMVEATYHVRRSGDEPIRKPLLILFFELRENGRILRLRINADVQYVEDQDREVFIDGIRRRKDFPSLFQFILETVRSLRLRELEIPKEKSRCSENPGYFASEVNSNALAVKADHCHEYDKLQFLRNAENIADHHKGVKSQKTSSNCSRCSSSTRSDLFETRDGLTCRECIASDLIHQLRLNRAPIDIMLTPTENLSNFDLLYGVVPAPLITELLKVSYLYYRHLNDPGLFLTQCPRCAVEVAVIPPSKEDIASCVCPECNSHWCWLCRLEPHWPMNCDEFKQWIVKWDQHYFVSKHLLLPNEDLLRINCTCGRILHLPSESAHNTLCRCGARYDKTEMMCWDHAWWPYYPRLRKERDLAGKPKDGCKVDVERIPCPKLIAKEFADVCTEVRNLRFDKKKRLEFEKSAMVSALESFDLANQRITGLLLVENCTAWLYLHRREDGFTKRKSAVLHLVQRLRSIENDISRNPPSSLLLRNAEELGRDIKNVMDSFGEHQ